LRAHTVTLLGQRQKESNTHVTTQKLSQEEEQAPGTRHTGGLWGVLTPQPNPGAGDITPLSILLVGGRGREADWDSEALPRCLTLSTTPKPRPKSTILMRCCFTSNNWTTFLAEMLHSTASSKQAFQCTIFSHFKSAKKKKICSIITQIAEGKCFTILLWLLHVSIRAWEAVWTHCKGVAMAVGARDRYMQKASSPWLEATPVRHKDKQKLQCPPCKTDTKLSSSSHFDSLNKNPRSQRNNRAQELSLNRAI